MRHRKSNRKLNRTSSHRRSMMRNMVCSLIEHEILITTLPKAKNIRPFAERIITKAKLGLFSRVFSLIGNNPVVVQKLRDVIASRYSSRNGGYIRILKKGVRPGDSAKMAVVELVDR